MLDEKDIERIIEAMEFKFPTKADFEDLKSDFRDLQTSVDVYAHKADGYFQEMVMLSGKLDRHEKWLHQLANKLGIRLEH